MPKKTVREILLEAAELVGRGWTRGAYARSYDGRRVAPNSPDACSWCLVGALVMAGGDQLHPKEVSAAVDPETDGNIIRWNDTVCQSGAEAAAMLRRAAERCGE